MIWPKDWISRKSANCWAPDWKMFIDCQMRMIFNLLEKGGRIVTITFHSLEDRIVKHSFLEFEKNQLGRVITKKPMVPKDEEIRDNRRSASAKLRVFEKLI